MNKYKETSINQYLLFKEIIKTFDCTHRSGDETIDSFELMYYILKNYSGIDNPRNLSIEQFNSSVGTINHLLNQQLKPEVLDVRSKYVINGKTFKLEMKQKDWTAGQFIDYSNITKEYKTNDDYIDGIGNILAIFLIDKSPNKMEYVERVEYINEYMSIQDGINLLFFFSIQFNLSLNNMKDYSKVNLVKMMVMKKILMRKLMKMK